LHGAGPCSSSRILWETNCLIPEPDCIKCDWLSVRLTSIPAASGHLSTGGLNMKLPAPRQLAITFPEAGYLLHEWKTVVEKMLVACAQVI